MDTLKPIVKYDFRMSHEDGDGIDHIKKHVRRLAEKHPHVYVGITQQRPGVRLLQHNRRWGEGCEWEVMYILYEAENLEKLIEIEGIIIEYCQRDYPEHTWNVRRSGRPREAEIAVGYALYVMIDSKLYSQ